VAQISRLTATAMAPAPARDIRKFFFAQIMFFSHKSPKTCKSALKFFIFLDTKPILPSYSIGGKLKWALLSSVRLSVRPSVRYFSAGIVPSKLKI
jgi:hypothetical protein